MSVALLPLCGTAKPAMRDGYTGQYAKIPLPFYTYGYWFVSGQQFTFPSSELPQDPSYAVRGTRQPSTFIKADGVCLNSLNS